MPIELTIKRVIKELLEKYNAKPKKYLGQYFVLSKNALSKMVAAAEIKKTDTILEIGPGLGTLTRELAKTGAKIIVVEKDSLMVRILSETLFDLKNVKVVRADARHLSPDLWIYETYKSGDKSVKIVANLPYNIATFLIRQWLESENLSALPTGQAGGRQVRPKMMVLMIQKEVARRICAAPPRANLLAMSVQFYAEPKIIGYVPKEMFWPKPKVGAAIIKIVPRKGKMAFFKRSREKQQFFKIMKAGFSQPRKQLAGNLTKKLNVPKENILKVFRNLDISEKIRAENLSFDQWQSLALLLIHN